MSRMVITNQNYKNYNSKAQQFNNLKLGMKKSL